MDQRLSVGWHTNGHPGLSQDAFKAMSREKVIELLPNDVLVLACLTAALASGALGSGGQGGTEPLIYLNNPRSQRMTGPIGE